MDLSTDEVAALVHDSYVDLFGLGHDVPIGPLAAQRVNAAEQVVRAMPQVSEKAWRSYSQPQGRTLKDGTVVGTTRSHRRQLARIFA